MKSHPLHNDYYHFNTVSVGSIWSLSVTIAIHTPQHTSFVTFFIFFFLHFHCQDPPDRKAGRFLEQTCVSNSMENENSVPRPPHLSKLKIILIQIYILINFPLSRSIHFPSFVLRTPPFQTSGNWCAFVFIVFEDGWELPKCWLSMPGYTVHGQIIVDHSTALHSESDATSQALKRPV